MNDRVSNKPPTTYIGEEEAQERYERENGEMRGRKMARPKNFTQHSNSSAVGSTADRSETSRHSSIFRFGRSLAASFNPSNWKIFSKVPEEIEETADQQILRERREKAESMYQQLKESGHFRDSTFGPSPFQRQEEKDSRPAKHDSGVEFGERRRSRSVSRMSRISTETPKEEKRMGRIFLEPPQLPTGNESHFSQSTNSTPQQSIRKGKFHFKKPSLSNIRNPTSENGSNSGNNHQARRIPSRKDLQKQQKLVKRVSDLEGRLEAARRQLADALDEPVPAGPPPGRQRFVPGAMPSLPSERLLSGYGDLENGMSESVSLSQIGKALTRDESRAIMLSEQPQVDAPSRRAPSPPGFDKSLPLEPDTPAFDHVMQSVEIEESESIDIEEPTAEPERPLVQSVAAREVQVVQQCAPLTSQLSSDGPSELSGLEDSEYEFCESEIKHDTSPEPSEISHLTAPRPAAKPQSSKQPSKSRKRKSRSNPDQNGDKTFKPVPETDSDISSIKPKRTPKKATTEVPPRKLQKTTNTNTSPLSRRNGTAPHRRQLSTSGKQSSIFSKSAKSMIPAKGQQSVSPPPSASFTGLDYKKPSSQPHQIGVDIGEGRMATYGAIPSADDNDVPPVPKLPKEFRLPSGEMVSIPAQEVNGRISGGGSKLQHTGSKLTKARPTPSPKKSGEKEQFEWPEDVF